MNERVEVIWKRLSQTEDGGVIPEKVRCKASLDFQNFSEASKLMDILSGEISFQSTKGTTELELSKKIITELIDVLQWVLPLANKYVLTLKNADSVVEHIKIAETQLAEYQIANSDFTKH